MLKYINYYEQLKMYTNKYKELSDLIDREEELFSRTQPGGTDYNKTPVQGHDEKITPMENYVIRMEHEDIYNKKEHLKAIVSDRYFLYIQAKKELLESEEIEDRIFIMYYINKYSYRKISRMIHYSKSNVGNILEKISKTIGLDKTGQI